MSQSAICDAFDLYLLSMPGLPPDIVIEGQAFNPQSNLPYVSSRMAAYSALPAAMGPNAVVVESGTYQVSVHRPAAEGRAGATAMADMVVAWFSRAKSLLTATGQTVIFESATGQPITTSASFITLPVVVAWMTTTG